MSTKHGLDEEGAVICTASPREDGSNVASNIDAVTCPHCRAGIKWFINECGDVYDYYVTRQAIEFPGDFHVAYETRAEAEAAAADLEAAAGGAVPALPMMTYDEAISYAIFAINTIENPDASEDRDVEQLLEHADVVLTTLVDLRETVRGLPRATL